MANIFVHIIIMLILLLTGCASKLPPSPPTLPALSLAEKIQTVENYLPVKGWFRWSEKTLRRKNSGTYGNLYKKD